MPEENELTPPEPTPVAGYAPPTGPATYLAAPVTPPPGRKVPWTAIIIIAVVTAFVVIVIGAIVALQSILTSVSQGSNYEPLVSGEPGTPSAPVGLECATVCFDQADVAATVLADSTLDNFGLTQHDFPYGTYDPTTADELFRSMTASWTANDGGPDACVFALGNSPSVVDLVSDDGVLDPIEFTGEHADEDVTTTIDQSVRVFPDSASAADHMSRLYDQIDGCDEISIGSPDERYSALITPAPALSLPDDIAVTGWVRTGDPGPRWRAYVFDLQRGNLVVRTRMLTDGSISEIDFRAFVEQYALQLGAIEPEVP